MERRDGGRGDGRDGGAVSPLDVPLPFPATKAHAVAIGDRVRHATGGNWWRRGVVEVVSPDGAGALVAWELKGGGWLHAKESSAELVVVGRARP